MKPTNGRKRRGEIRREVETEIAAFCREQARTLEIDGIEKLDVRLNRKAEQFFKFALRLERAEKKGER